MAGEGEEHVVERRLVDLDVVDRDAGVVERAHDRGGQAGGALDGCAQATPVVTFVHRAGDERRKRRGGVGARL
jgi:hypothetical protein